MPVAPGRAVHQRFLPPGKHRAFVWKYSAPIGGRRPRHFHAEPELNLVVRGTARFGIGDSVVPVSPGELIAFPAAQDHVLLEASPDLFLYAFGLDAAFAADVQRREPGLPIHVGLSARELGPVLQRAADIVDRPGSDQLGAELWERLHGLSRVAPTRRAHPFIHVLTRRSLALLRAAPELSLSSLARDLKAHSSELSRHFHRDMGITLSRYRTRLRLLRLIEQVGEGGELTSAAFQAGFGSYSQCHRAFQAELGCSPRRFFSGARHGMQHAYADASLPVFQ